MSSHTSEPKSSPYETRLSEDSGQSKQSREDRGSHASGSPPKPALESNTRQSEPSVQRSPLERRSENLERHLEELRRTVRSLKEQLSQKDSELTELKKTLCMYDECSEGDIGNMVDGINAKIQSLARNTAVKWVKDAGKGAGGGQGCATPDASEGEWLRKHIGVQLVNALTDASNGQKALAPVFLQLAWQAVIVRVLCTLLGSFSAILARGGPSREVEDVLEKLADDVRDKEIQPAYGRWRALTHNSLRSVLNDDEDKAIRTYMNRAVRRCHHATKLIMKRHCPDDQTFRSALQDQIRDIVQEAFKLLTAMQEKVVTANYEPFISQSGHPFRPDIMVIGKQDKPYKDDRVVCAIGLGMVFSRKRGRENTSESPRMIMRKPQILTECNLNEMIADV